MQTVLEAVPPGSVYLEIYSRATHRIPRATETNLSVAKGETIRHVFEVRCPGQIAWEHWNEGPYQLRYLDEFFGERILSEGPLVRFSTTWSRDGNWLAFSSAEQGDTAVYVIRSDGSGRAHIAIGMHPIFSPDGREIACLNRTENGGDIWVSNLEDSTHRQIVGLPPGGERLWPGMVSDRQSDRVLRLAERRLAARNLDGPVGWV